jgi:hypothetical protein
MSLINFGKHKGKTVEQVYATDRNYLIWLSDKETILRTRPEIKEFIELKFGSNVDKSYILNWGRYRNKSAKFIFENDKPYFEWLLSSDFVNDKCPKLKEELVRLQNQ